MLAGGLQFILVREVFSLGSDDERRIQISHLREQLIAGRPLDGMGFLIFGWLQQEVPDTSHHAL